MTHIFTVTLPDIGEGVVEGEVIEWLKKIDEELKQDEPVVIVMTDKATVELPAPYPGKLAKMYIQPGQIAIKGKALYDIEVAENVATHKNLTREKTAPSAPAPLKKAPLKDPLPCAAKKALAVPAMRKIAHELGIDLNQMPATGSHGQVTHEDIKQYLSQESAPKALLPTLALVDDKVEPLLGIRQAMAQKMALSKQMIPHFSYFEQVEATRLIKLRSKIKFEAAKENIQVTFMPFFIKALSLTLKQYPLFNSSLDLASNSIRIHQAHHIGIAMSTKLGLIVAVLRDVDQMSLTEVIRSYEALKERAAHHKLSPHDMKDSTITISNFGVLGGGGLWATPIINYPEVGILALSKIQKQPTAKNGAVEIRDFLNLSWSFDHRIIDGDMAATFSHYYATLIRNPAPLL
ncbi:MAG: dihydrolipoamide acetyltransferase [Parachlamydia sp.]|nr:MAG: dihydrolipoamide acetyltransferase [Parachlamydia sp.]